uniref:WD_REPEATS_REGION domain-containing protein n=1 Tax=Globodera pallida TaxID=36090 RepID=A0A183CBP9_GLOPA
MRLKYLSSVVSASDEISCAGALCYSPNGRKLAVGTADRHILLFDDKLRRRDKFGTKPVDAKFGKASYLIKCAAFSPDSTKLAVGQTDHIVFVYRLGDTWNEKKVICNKFAQSSAVMAQCWPSESKLIIGLLDGKVRCASASSNKCSTLYRAETAVTVLAQHPNRKSFLSGHSDGTIFLFSFETRYIKVCVHSCAPQALLLSGVGILTAGTDRRIVSYSEHGRQLQQFDYSRVEGEKEFTAAALDSLGHSAVFGSFNRIRLMCWNQRRGAWDEANSLIIHNLYTMCSLAWKADGSTLICANVLGAVIAIDCAMRKTLLRNRFEVTFVSPSQAIIKDLKVGEVSKSAKENEEAEGQAEGAQKSCVLHSGRGHELGDIRVMGREQRYAIAYTSSTLILADMHTGLSSEIQWQSGGNEKFFLENENVAYIVNAGEINFVEYGRNELVGWIRTERANPHLISVRLCRAKPKKIEDPDNEDQPRKIWPNMNKEEEINRVAYLLDAKTIAVVNLVNGVQLAQLGHGSPIDWLELNERANKLLFRDLRAALHLYALETGITTHLVGHCSYVQWVPRSDVVVAQSNEQVCVWYNTDDHNGSAERVVHFVVQGDVEQVARDATHTEVIVLENGVQRVAYELDSALIEFGTALDELDLGRAVAFLEQSERQGMDVQTMWRRLAQVALQHSQLMVAQRCYASLNDLVRVQFLQRTQMRAERQFGGPMESEALASHFEVRARLAMMSKQFKMAERIYLENNSVAEAIAMWHKMGNWEQALDLARAVSWPELDQLRVQHEHWLEETGQMEKVAELKAREGLLSEALELYLNANQPGQAVQSHSYGQAIQIARVEFPERVLPLELEWANWLFDQGNYSQAVPHFLEGGNLLRAVDSAIRSREWEKALEILRVLDPTEETNPFYGRIAQHFELEGQLDKVQLLQKKQIF